MLFLRFNEYGNDFKKLENMKNEVSTCCGTLFSHIITPVPETGTTKDVYICKYCGEECNITILQKSVKRRDSIK
jgi:hypothetical protein